jgi:hypothetical protein
MSGAHRSVTYGGGSGWRRTIEVRDFCTGYLSRAIDARRIGNDVRL